MTECLQFRTAGESHGRGLIAVVEGLPADLPVRLGAVNRDLARRQGGYGRGERMGIERDEATALSGIRHGRTLGSPIALLVKNREWEKWKDEMAAEPPAAEGVSGRRVQVPRPGHADLSGGAKYGHRDLRNCLERSSARETAARVAAGGVCRALLSEFGIEVHSDVLQIGTAQAVEGDVEEVDWGEVEASEVRCADSQATASMKAAIDGAKEAGDTVGGVFRVVALGVPPGLGTYAQWDARLDGRLAQALMSIPSVKAVAIGLGWEVCERAGSEVHDEITYDAGAAQAAGWGFVRATNRAGGLEGGVTNGEPIVLKAAQKPIPTLVKPLQSVDLDTKEQRPAHHERSDVCTVPAAAVVGEAMVAFVLASALREKFGGDRLADMRAGFEHYLARLRDY